MNKFVTSILFVIRKYFFRIVFFSIVLVAVLCLNSYEQSFQSASAVLAFTYPNASDGLFPNGTYFNAYNILTDEIIEKGIRNAGLKGKVNLHAIADKVKVRPRSGTSLITTQYIVSYSVGKGVNLGAVSADGLLQSIIYAYIDFFHATYSNDQIVLNLDDSETADMEYIDFINHYNVTLNRLQKYLRAQQEDNKDFISSDGTSFQDLLNIIERYRLTSLKEIRSIVTERGVTLDQKTYTERLKYRIWNLTNTYAYNRNMQELYKKILQNYESRLTSVVFVPSLDSERKFYMSKTKVGLDIHSINATNYEEKAEEIQRQINQTDQYIKMITDRGNISAAPVNTGRVNDAIASLMEQLDATMNSIRHVEKEFSQYKNHDYVVMTLREPSFIERIDAKNALMLTVIIDAVLVVLLAVHKSTKKGKESN